MSRPARSISGVRVLEALVEVNARTRATTLVVTHNADVARLGDRVVRFLDGRIRSIDVNAVRTPPAELVGAQAQKVKIAHQE